MRIARRLDDELLLSAALNSHPDTMKQMNRYHIRLRSIFTMLLPAFVAMSRQSYAQTAPTVHTEGALAARRALVERAQDAATAGRHAVAVALAEEAGRIELTPSLRAFLSRELGNVSRFASALEQAELCLREAQQDATVARREVLITECRRLLTLNQSRVVLVTVVVPSNPAPGIVVRVGSRVIVQSEFGLPLPIDPGELLVEATAPNVEPFRVAVRGIAGAFNRTEIPARFSASNGPSSTNTSTNINAGSTPNPNPNLASNPSRIDPPTSSPRREPPVQSHVGAGPFVLGGIAVVSFGLSGGFAVLQSAAFSAAGCRPSGGDILCSNATQVQAFMSPTGPDPYTPNLLLNASLGVGAAALVGGVTWLIVGATRSTPTHQSRASNVRLHGLSPTWSANEVLLRLFGAF